MTHEPTTRTTTRARERTARRWRRTRRTGATAAGIVVLALIGATTLVASPVSSQSPSPDPQVGAGYAAGWLADQVVDEGFIPLPDDAPNVGATVEAALALAAAGVEGATFHRMVEWLEANVATVIAPFGSTSPGAIGYLMLIGQVAGTPATDFGGTNLVTALAATLGAHEPGLYGEDDPTWDGVFRQALAILGLVASNQAVPAQAISWLQDQQCSTPAAAAGGWEAYRTTPADPCEAPDPTFFVGPDSNSTALAIQALAATGDTGVAAGLDFLGDTQEPDGGWSYIAGAGQDPNSTSVVIQAILAGGEDPTDWVRDGATPYDALLGWQIGCEAPEADRGAFASPFSDGFPDLFATRQAIWGASGRPFPLGDTSFGPSPDPCAPPSPPTTIGPLTPTTVTTAPDAPVSAPIAAAPSFAG